MRLREYKVRNLIVLAQLQEEVARKYGEEAREIVKTLIKRTFALGFFNIVDYITTIILLSEKYPEFKALLPSRHEVEEIFKEKECQVASSKGKGNSTNNNKIQGHQPTKLIEKVLNHLPVQPQSSQPAQPQQPRILGEKEGWDRKVDYTSMYNALASVIMREEDALYKSRCNAAMALTILSNGLLPIEGVEAFKEALRNNASVVYVMEKRRGKRGKRESEPSFKEVKIPEIARSVFPLCKKLLDISDQRIVRRLAEWMRRTYGVNPYSLRYSYLRHHNNNIAGAPVQRA